MRILERQICKQDAQKVTMHRIKSMTFQNCVIDENKFDEMGSIEAECSPYGKRRKIFPRKESSVVPKERYLIGTRKHLTEILSNAFRLKMGSDPLEKLRSDQNFRTSSINHYLSLLSCLVNIIFIFAIKISCVTP